MNNTKRFSILSKDGVSYLIPFILITSCFALWGDGWRIGASRFLWWLFCNGFSGCYIYPPVFL